MADTLTLLQLAQRSAMPPVASWTDTSANTNSGGGTSPIRISAIWTIPAYDALAGTVYTIDVPYAATMEGNSLELGLSVDGSATFTVNDTISGTIVSAGAGIQGTVRITLQVLTTGTGGTANAFTGGTVGQVSAPTTFANSGSLAGNPALALALNTTVSHTLRVNAAFAAVTAGQTVTGYGSVLSRWGR